MQSITPVEESVWKNLNNRLEKLDACGYFFPLSADDAYAAAAQKVLETSARIDRGEIALKSASRETYLTKTAYTALQFFFRREVAPIRRENDASVGKLTTDEMTLRDLAEALPGEPSAEVRRAQAAALLEEVFTALRECAPAKERPERAIAAFRAYLAADGNKAKAAEKVGVSSAWFYRQWPRWIALAQEVADVH